MTDLTVKEQLLQGLLDAGCNESACRKIGSLFDAGSYGEMLHQMRKQRCVLVEEMHESQRKVDRMDYLIHAQEKGYGKREKGK